MSADDLVKRLRTSDGFKVSMASDGHPYVHADKELLTEAAARIEELERREQFYRAKLRDYVEDVAGPDTTASMGVIDKMAARSAGEVTP
jgi:hypothetical protein